MLEAVSAFYTTMRVKFASDEGAGIVEYLLLIVLVALVALAAINLLGNSASDQFNNISNEVNGA